MDIPYLEKLLCKPVDDDSTIFIIKDNDLLVDVIRQQDGVIRRKKATLSDINALYFLKGEPLVNTGIMRGRYGFQGAFTNKNNEVVSMYVTPAGLYTSHMSVQFALLPHHGGYYEILAPYVNYDSETISEPSSIFDNLSLDYILTGKLINSKSCNLRQITSQSNNMYSLDEVNLYATYEDETDVKIKHLPVENIKHLPVENIEQVRNDFIIHTYLDIKIEYPLPISIWFGLFSKSQLYNLYVQSMEYFLPPGKTIMDHTLYPHVGLNTYKDRIPCAVCLGDTKRSFKWQDIGRFVHYFLDHTTFNNDLSSGLYVKPYMNDTVGYRQNYRDSDYDITYLSIDDSVPIITQTGSLLVSCQTEGDIGKEMKDQTYVFEDPDFKERKLTYLSGNLKSHAKIIHEIEYHDHTTLGHTLRALDIDTNNIK